MARTPAEVGRAAKERREQLGLRQKDIAGVSEPWLRKFEKGEGGNARPSTIAALEESLGWVRGSIQALVEGAQPIELDDDDPPTRAPSTVVALLADAMVGHLEQIEAELVAHMHKYEGQLQPDDRTIIRLRLESLTQRANQFHAALTELLGKVHE